MIRTLVATTLLLALAAPASAQEVVTVPAPAPAGTIVVTAPTQAGAVYAAPAPAPAPAYATTSTPYPPTYGSPFPPRDRHGRALVGTRHEMQNDRGLWGAGLGLFLGGWVLDLVGTALANAMSHDRTDAAEQDAQAWSILPLVGPVVQLGIEAPHPAIPITSGLMQISGLVMFIVGLTSEHDAEIPIYAWGDPSDPRTPRLGLEVAPTQGGAMGTLSLRL